ncbi:MAG: hypothetical protein WA705_01720 [Candidatus Ozemobacteraceae bacterium]
MSTYGFPWIQDFRSNMYDDSGGFVAAAPGNCRFQILPLAKSSG